MTECSSQTDLHRSCSTSDLTRFRFPNRSKIFRTFSTGHLENFSLGFCSVSFSVAKTHCQKSSFSIFPVVLELQCSHYAVDVKGFDSVVLTQLGFFLVLLLRFLHIFLHILYSQTRLNHQIVSLILLKFLKNAVK